jgi:hypothetical protein
VEQGFSPAASEVLNTCFFAIPISAIFLPCLRRKR